MALILFVVVVAEFQWLALPTYVTILVSAPALAPLLRLRLTRSASGSELKRACPSCFLFITIPSPSPPTLTSAAPRQRLQEVAYPELQVEPGGARAAHQVCHPPRAAPEPLAGVELGAVLRVREQVVLRVLRRLRADLVVRCGGEWGEREEDCYEHKVYLALMTKHPTNIGISRGTPSVTALVVGCSKVFYITNMALGTPGQVLE